MTSLWTEESHAGELTYHIRFITVEEYNRVKGLYFPDLEEDEEHPPEVFGYCKSEDSVELDGRDTLQEGMRACADFLDKYEDTPGYIWIT